MTIYLIRFDDITPKMNWRKFELIKNKLDQYNIKSILGVIPENKDSSLEVSDEYPNYIKKLKSFRNNGDIIAQHGLNHLYDSEEKGLFGVQKKSEFAGFNYSIQLKKIQEGKIILSKNGLWQPYFMAPSHSFDHLTIQALLDEGFEYLTDGFSLFPFKYEGLIMIPQYYSMPLPKWLPCLSQLCIHINTINVSKLNYLMNFIDNNYRKFINPNQINRYIDKFKFTNLIFSNLIKIYKNRIRY